MSIKSECSRTEHENECLISPLKKIVRFFFIKIRTGIAAIYKFSDGLCRPRTLRGLLVFPGALFTNTYNRVKFTTPISEEEVSVSAMYFFWRVLWGSLLTSNGGTNLFRI